MTEENLNNQDYLLLDTLNDFLSKDGDYRIPLFLKKYVNWDRYNQMMSYEDIDGAMSAIYDAVFSFCLSHHLPQPTVSLKSAIRTVKG